MLSMKIQMGRGVVLLLTLFLPSTNAVKKATSSSEQCTNYLRCRNDEVEQRWNCQEPYLTLVTEFCQVGEHVKSAKMLAEVRESTFAACIAKNSVHIDADGASTMTSCNKTSPSNSRRTCDDFNNASNRRCDGFLECCAVSSRCQKQSEYLTISKLLLIERTSIERLLNDCRVNVQNFLTTNITKNDREMAMKVLTATAATINLINGLEESSTVMRLQLEPRAIHRPENVSSSNTIDYSKTTSIKTLVLPKSFLPRMSYVTRKSSKIYNITDSYRRRAQVMEEARTARPELFRTRPSQKTVNPKRYFGAIVHRSPSNLQTSDKKLKEGQRPGFTKARSSHPVHHIHPTLRPATKLQGAVPASKLPFKIDLIIERSFPTYSLRHQSTTSSSASLESFRYTGEELHTLAPPPAPSSPPRFVQLQTDTYSSVNSVGLKPSTPPPYRKLTPRRIVIRRPWVSQSQIVRHGINRRTNKLLRKKKLKPQKSLLTSTTNPAVSFGRHSVVFPSDNETFTDRTKPHRSRLPSKKRTEKNEGKPLVGLFDLRNVSATTTIRHGSNQQERAVLQSTADEIYEDILQQQKEPLIDGNTAPMLDVDFDESSVSNQPKQRSDWSLSSSVFDAAHPRSFKRVDSIATKSSRRPALLFHRRKNRKIGKKLLGASAPVPPLKVPITLHREDMYSSSSADNPLDAPILLQPLTNGRGKPNSQRIELPKQLSSRKSDSFIVFKKTPTSSPKRLQSLSSSDNNSVAKNITTAPLSAYVSTTAPFINGFPFRIVAKLATSTSPRSFLSSSPIPSKTKTNNMQVKNATITSTVMSEPQTPATFEMGSRSSAIPYRRKATINSTLRVIDSMAGKTSSTQNMGANHSKNKNRFSSPLHHKTASADLDRLWPQVHRKHAQAMASKTYGSERIPSKLAPIQESSTTEENTSEAFSVLKLPETTIRLSHCEVYSLCLDEFEQEEKKCRGKATRMMADPAKRRAGSCYRKLLRDYQYVYEEARRLEKTYNSCIKNRLGATITEVAPTKCAAHSPPSLTAEPCYSRLHALKYHCSKLARCCPDADLCRNEVNRSDAARTLRRRKESLAVAATKCQINSNKSSSKESQGQLPIVINDMLLVASANYTGGP